MKRKFFQEEDPVAQLHSINLRKALWLEELLFLCAYYKADKSLTLAQSLDKLLHINLKSPQYGFYAHYVYSNNIEEIKKSNISLDFKWYPAFKKARGNINQKLDKYTRVDWAIRYGINDYARFMVQLCPDLLPPDSSMMDKYGDDGAGFKTDVEAIIFGHFLPSSTGLNKS